MQPTKEQILKAFQDAAKALATLPPNTALSAFRLWLDAPDDGITDDIMEIIDS